jgi:hypothetical protein
MAQDFIIQLIGLLFELLIAILLQSTYLYLFDC